MNSDSPHHHNSHNTSGFTAGIILGVVIGVALALLFSTKKGKKLLKVLTEEGLEKISGLEEILGDVLEEEVDEEMGEEEELPVANVKPSSSKAVHHEEVKEVIVERAPLTSDGVPSQAPLQKVTTTTRRFFRGVPRRN